MPEIVLHSAHYCDHARIMKACKVQCFALSELGRRNFVPPSIVAISAFWSRRIRELCSKHVHVHLHTKEGSKRLKWYTRPRVRLGRLILAALVSGGGGHCTAHTSSAPEARFSPVPQTLWLSLFRPYARAEQQPLRRESISRRGLLTEMSFNTFPVARSPHYDTKLDIATYMRIAT